MMIIYRLTSYDLTLTFQCSVVPLVVVKIIQHDFFATRRKMGGFKTFAIRRP